MARRRILEPHERPELNALPVSAPDVDEAEHFYTCPTCNQLVVMRRLGDVLHHEDAGHEPIVQADTEALPKFIEPLLPTLVDEPPEGEDWCHEIKYDGWRVQLHIRHDEGFAFTRNGFDWSDKFRPLIDAALKLPCETAIIDGEVILQGEDGKCDFHGLRSAINSEPHRLVFMAFDLLELDGQDLRKRTLDRRRELLNKLTGRNDPASPIQYSAEVVGHAKAFFMVVEGMGLEGIVSKRRDSTYRSGRSDCWLKVKCFAEVELIVIGTEQGVGPTTALLARETAGGLEYAGGAMLTLCTTEREQFWQEVEQLKRPTPVLPMNGRKKATWTEPVMRVRVRTLRGEETLRHANVLAIVSMPA